jgi:Domain of unknown function (DUF1707)
LRLVIVLNRYQKEARCPVDSNRTLRVSDADRDAAVSELGEHFQEGRLDRDELEDRTGRALSARTGSDLDELLADLPHVTRAPARTPAAVRPRPALVPFMVPVLVGLALTVTILIAGAGRGHHPWPFVWAAWWIVPVMMMRLLCWRRIGGARSWR